MAQKTKLTYYNYRASAEPIRYLLALAGIEYEDYRFADQDFPKLKNSFPYGQVPVLEINGKVIPQTVAICRYLAKKSGLAGSDDFEAMQIDAVVDSIIDLREFIHDAYWRGVEEHRPAKQEKLLKELLPFYMERFEKNLQDNNGYFVNGKLSFADVVFAAFEQYFSDNVGKNITEGCPLLTALVEKVNNLPRIKEWIEKRPETSY